MEKQQGLRLIYRGEYTVYQRDGMYCFLKGRVKQPLLLLKESYALGGQYLFCPHAVENAEQFCENGIGYLKRWNRCLLFLWIENPEEVFFNWRINKLEASEGSQTLMFENYRFLLGNDRVISVREETFFIAFSREDSYCFSSGKIQLIGTAKELKLKTEGTECGTLIGSLFVRVEDNMNLMEGLDAGIYFSRLMEESEAEAAEHGFLAHSVSRVFIPKGKITVEMSVIR